MKLKMSRREFVRLAAAGAAASTAAAMLLTHPGKLFANDTQKAKKPNIVFIMADDMGYGDVGCYNDDSKIPTPNMDRLAAEGIRFTNAHSPSAVCSPTRYGVLTGRYCWRTYLKKGVLYGESPLLVKTDRMTIASLLKQNGYAAACIGKWHLGFGNQYPVDYSKPLRPGPLELGFDYFFGIPASLGMTPICFVENDHVVGKLVNRKTPGWRHEDVGPTLTKKAIEFIDNHVKKNPSQPFFLHLLTSAPHRPCTPPDFIKGKSKAGPRGDMVYEVDWTVGQVLNALNRHNLTDNTLVIVTSDNGAIPGGKRFGKGWKWKNWETYKHKACGNWRGYKTHIWEGGHRVPFIARWPGKIKPASVSDEIICLTDMLATYAAIVGAELPENAGEDSYNILPAVLGQKLDKPIREATIVHSQNGIFAVKRGHWKLILGRRSGGEIDREFLPRPPQPGNPEGQLYNLAKDSAETNNLYLKNAPMVERLTTLLEKYKMEGHSRPK